ncbi:MAG: hypothetical protein KTR31_02725 [Myxococcales bacterium]|nr:hypothetical protein [Myxococcales bacterium]
MPTVRGQAMSPELAIARRRAAAREHSEEASPKTAETAETSASPLRPPTMRREVSADPPPKARAQGNCSATESRGIPAPAPAKPNVQTTNRPAATPDFAGNHLSVARQLLRSRPRPTTPIEEDDEDRVETVLESNWGGPVPLAARDTVELKPSDEPEDLDPRTEQRTRMPVAFISESVMDDATVEDPGFASAQWRAEGLFRLRPATLPPASGPPPPPAGLRTVTPPLASSPPRPARAAAGPPGPPPVPRALATRVSARPSVASPSVVSPPRAPRPTRVDADVQARVAAVALPGRARPVRPADPPAPYPDLSSSDRHRRRAQAVSVAAMAVAAAGLVAFALLLLGVPM